MARRRPASAPAPIVGRPFTPGEIAEIRRLIAGWRTHPEHPHPSVTRLEAIHAAAGRARRFKLWEIDLGVDVDRALAEELSPTPIPDHISQHERNTT